MFTKSYYFFYSIEVQETFPPSKLGFLFSGGGAINNFECKIYIVGVGKVAGGQVLHDLNNTANINTCFFKKCTVE